MAANNGGHIKFVGHEAAVDPPAANNVTSSALKEKEVEHDVDSVYDEEDVMETKDSDFKHKQVCAAH
jgi:hypothetical protein